MRTWYVPKYMALRVDVQPIRYYLSGVVKEKTYEIKK